MDSSRLRTGELVAGIGGVALFVFLFFDWFGAGIEGFDEGVSGWDGLGLDFSGFIVALSSFAAVALALLAISGQKVNLPIPRGTVTAVLGLLSVAIIVWRIFANPGDIKVGLFLGLIAAVAIAAGALMALREDGFEPLVSVPGGRTASAAASPPVSTADPEPPTTEAPASTGQTASGSTKSGSSGSSSAERSTGGGEK